MKIALFEVGTTSIRLTLCKAIDGESFVIYKKFSENIAISENIENGGLIKAAKIKEAVAILELFKKICDAEEIRVYYGVAAANLANAMNHKSLIDEAQNATGVEFKILTPEAEVAAVYTSVINTLDVPKGVIVNISSHTTRIIHYNRRVILDSVIIPFGSASILARAENMPVIAVDLFKKELVSHAGFLQNLDPETTIVGVSDVFVSMARLSRKMRRYPVDIDHNYAVNAEGFTQVFDFVKSLDMEKRQKLKGISSASAQTIVGGMCIIDAIMRFSGLKNIVTACSYRNVGILLNNIVPSTLEKPVTDVLGFSLECVAQNSGLDKASCARGYTYALMLFRQLRVLHKLPRAYIKPLRIAAYLYNIGLEKINYHAILACGVMGASHKDIVLAAFAASVRKWEDFNLAEWVKYKELVTDDDLEAVRKIAVLVTMADTLNMRNLGTVKDITCDILGDSVILKLVCETDPKTVKVDVKAAELEIFYSKKHAGEFLRAFKKNLEIL